MANEIADRYGYWLGDAFASGGSEGYDHKKMGITARGAWESVRWHFAALRLNPDTDDFTAVGIGDMSGDVFGNGMLLSEHIKLIAAFDHRGGFRLGRRVGGVWITVSPAVAGPSRPGVLVQPSFPTAGHDG